MSLEGSNERSRPSVSPVRSPSNDHREQEIASLKEEIKVLKAGIEYKKAKAKFYKKKWKNAEAELVWRKATVTRESRSVPDKEKEVRQEKAQVASYGLRKV